MSILGFSASDILSILQLGISGVAFIFLAMSYILLRKEQERKEEPRDNILRSIKQFSLLSFAFAVLVAGIGVLDGFSKPTTMRSSSCQDAIDRASLLSVNKDDHDFDSIYGLLSNTLNQCKK